MKTMNLIDRYVYAVTERLPEDIRDDVSRELRANIEDMLSGEPSEEEVRAVLEKLGHPVKLAQEYNPVKSYLIGPAYYRDYIAVLKLVTGIAAAVLVCITLVKYIFDPPVNGDVLQYTVQFIVDIIAAGLQGFVQGAVWVTLIFAVSERFDGTESNPPLMKKKWTPDDLPPLPVANKSRISRGGTVFAMVCTVFFTTLIYFNPQIIAVYELSGSGPAQVTPLFSAERLKFYMPVILIIAFLQMSLNIWKFISGHRSIPMAWANALLNTGFCVFILVLFRDKALFNPGFISRIETLAGPSQSANVSAWLEQSLLTGAAVITAICLWDSISEFLKCPKREISGDKKTGTGNI